jgi:hypothetical protein
MSKTRVTVWLLVIALAAVGLGSRSLRSATSRPDPASPQGAKDYKDAGEVYQVISKPVPAAQLDQKLFGKAFRPAALPATAVFMCGLYGEASQGGNAYSSVNKCPIQPNFPIDRSFHQSTIPNCTGGGASSPLQPADIPAGFFIACDGGFYWAVLPPIEQLALEVDPNGNVKQWGLGVPMYCGPSGGSAGGCNVKVAVYAVRKP